MARLTYPGRFSPSLHLSFGGLKDLMTSIERFVRDYNVKPRPFSRMSTTDSNLGKFH